MLFVWKSSVYQGLILAFDSVRRRSSMIEEDARVSCFFPLPAPNAASSQSSPSDAVTTGGTNSGRK